MTTNIHTFAKNIDVKKVNRKMFSRYGNKYYKDLSLTKQRMYHMACVQKMTIPTLTSILFYTGDINFFNNCMKDGIESDEALEVEMVD
jgi:hypothetical protein